MAAQVQTVNVEDMDVDEDTVTSQLAQSVAPSIQNSNAALALLPGPVAQPTVARIRTSFYDPLSKEETAAVARARALAKVSPRQRLAAYSSPVIRDLGYQDFLTNASNRRGPQPARKKCRSFDLSSATLLQDMIHYLERVTSGGLDETNVAYFDTSKLRNATRSISLLSAACDEENSAELKSAQQQDPVSTRSLYGIVHYTYQSVLVGVSWKIFLSRLIPQ